MKATLKNTAASLGRILRYARGNKIQYGAGLVLSSLDNVILNGMLGILLIVIFAGVEKKDASAFQSIAFVAGGGICLLALSIVVGGLFFRKAGVLSAARFRQDVMDHALSLPASWLDERHSGDVLSRMTADMQSTEQAFGWNIQFPLRSLLSGIGGAVMMFATDWRFALLATLLGFLSIWATTRFATPIRRISEKIQSSVGRIAECASDLLAAAPLLRLFNLGGWACERMGAASKEAYKSSMKRTGLQTGQDAVNTLSGWCMFIGLIVIGSAAVLSGLLPFSRMIGLVQFNGSMLMMFQTIGSAFTQLQASLAGANRVMELLDAEQEPAQAEAPRPADGAPAIVMKDVGFAYEAGREVLSGFTGTVRRGETVALVGGSGSGKSTALKLLMGFYPSQSGEISLFGRNLGHCRTALRSFAAYVPQSCYLFSGTVRDNIAAGRPGATDGDVQAAAAAAMAHDFIMELPQGYDTEVGERGTQLSGGQRQRISIARAVLKNAPILLLDEATASLDSQAEAHVQAALERLMAGRTVVVVAHRLSTVRNADRILVMEGGRIVEQGSHEELLARSQGRYASFYKAQFEGIASEIA